MQNVEQPEPGSVATFDAAVERMARLAGQRNALDAELVDTVAAVIESGAWCGDGYRSVGHWLTIQLGLSYSQARRLEDVARRVGEFPLTADQFRAGLLSIDQFRAVALAAPSWADVHAFELVRYATEPQIRRIMRAEFPDYDPSAPPPDDTANPADGAKPTSTDTNDSTDSEQNDDDVAADTPDDTGDPHDLFATLDDDPTTAFHQHFSARWTNDGRYVGSFDLAAPAGLVVSAALSEARDALFRSGTPNVTWVNALVEIARRAQDAAPPNRADRHKIMVHIDTNNLPEPDGSPVTELANGARLPQSIAEYLCCDSHMRPVWETDHLPLGVGTTTRTIPDRLRRIIEHRDQGCRVPGCAATIVETHHIIHWDNGGQTELWNLISLCGKHHQMHHAGRLGITGNPHDDTLTFHDRHGRPIQFAPQPIPPDDQSPISRTPRHRPPDYEHHDDDERPSPDDPGYEPIYRHPPGERLNLRWFSTWRPPDEYASLSKPDADAWHTHLARRRTLNDPPAA